MNKRLFFIFLFFISGAILYFSVSFLTEPKVLETSLKPAQFSEPKIIENETVTIILVGDIMLDRGVEYLIEKHGCGDFKFPFLKIADYLKTADIVFGNLEGVISDKGIKVGSIYSFRARPEAIEALKFAGFNVLSLANNHALDYTKAALEDCLTRLNNDQIEYIGAGFTEKEAFSPLIKKINGLKIGFLAYTNLGPESWRAGENNSGIAWISKDDFEKIKNDIETAKKESNVLIVSLHSGEEYQKEPTQFQVDFAKMAIDAGADLVIGHHPHVVQLNEIYNGGYIFYSLGNFIFDQNFSDQTLKGQILELLIESGTIKKVNPLSIKINDFFQPQLEIFDTEDY